MSSDNIIRIIDLDQELILMILKFMLPGDVDRFLSAIREFWPILKHRRKTVNNMYWHLLRFMDNPYGYLASPMNKYAVIGGSIPLQCITGEVYPDSSLDIFGYDGYDYSVIEEYFEWIGYEEYSSENFDWNKGSVWDPKPTIPYLRQDGTRSHRVRTLKDSKGRIIRIFLLQLLCEEPKQFVTTFYSSHLMNCWDPYTKKFYSYDPVGISKKVAGLHHTQLFDPLHPMTADATDYIHALQFCPVNAEKYAMLAPGTYNSIKKYIKRGFKMQNGITGHEYDAKAIYDEIVNDERNASHNQPEWWNVLLTYDKVELGVKVKVMKNVKFEKWKPDE